MKMKNEFDPGIEFFKTLLKKMISFKYIYILSVFLFVSLAFVYNKYAPKFYELNSTIGPVNDTRNSVLSSGDMFKSAYYSGKNIEDIINNLYSFELVSKTVNDLNLEVGYFSDSTRLYKQYTEIYLLSPFIVNIDKSHIQPIGAKFQVDILSESTFRLSASKKIKPSDGITFLFNYLDNAVVAKDGILYVDTLCKFNEMISNRYFKFSISPKKEFLHGALSSKRHYYFELYHPGELVKKYLKKLSIEPVSYIATIIKIQFNSKNLYKSLNFLNSFVNSFLEENLAKKNKIALSTLNFIDSQIAEMSDSLLISESNLKDFRSNNQVMDISYQGQQLSRQMADIESQRTNLEQQLRYYNYLLNYFKTNQDISGITPPSSAIISDPVMNNLISEIIKTNTEKSAFSNSGEKNVYLVQIENRIRTQKQTIIEAVTNNISTLNLTLSEINYKAEKLKANISNLPRQEMKMVSIQRKFNLDNTLYTYLLQKRSEAAISLSSTYPDYEVLEPAREITAKIIRPKAKLNYLISLFLSLLFPTIFLIIRDLFTDKISSVYDIEHLLDRSALGIIYSNPRKFESVFKEAPGSALAESFRNLRSSLFLKLKTEQSKVILITSSQPQDGKSFISFNLAISIASVGFKTVLIDCDLRRPVLHNKFDDNNSTGISNYMIKEVKEDQIIRKTSIENLSFIPTGPILPNPSELISSGSLDNLFNYLKSKYEYIIIDTAPLGLVADSIQLMKYASQLLVVSRINYTKKEVLVNALTLLDSNNINNYEVVANDQNFDNSPYSRYRSYYHKAT